ncbi:MAG TPA: hypothetical protein VIJ26_15335, partial [Thermoanaerobaculia bacterium]
MVGVEPYRHGRHLRAAGTKVDLQSPFPVGHAEVGAGAAEADLPGGRQLAGGRGDRGFLLVGGRRRRRGRAYPILVAAGGEQGDREQKEEGQASRHERAKNVQEGCHGR